MRTSETGAASLGSHGLLALGPLKRHWRWFQWLFWPIVVLTPPLLLTAIFCATAWVLVGLIRDGNRWALALGAADLAATIALTAALVRDGWLPPLVALGLGLTLPTVIGGAAAVLVAGSGGGGHPHGPQRVVIVQPPAVAAFDRKKIDIDREDAELLLAHCELCSTLAEPSITADNYRRFVVAQADAERRRRLKGPQGEPSR